MSETSVYDKYEAVIGLEVHAQLLTHSKAFCSDSTEYGALPNTQVGVISLAHPGTLPMHNIQAVNLAIKMGLATSCTIREENQYARKNYFYADLPKGYQITQDKTPICHDGFIEVKQKDGKTKHIGIQRIHMEEDSGKSMHDQDVYDSLIDYNRAGTALIEIVTDPDLRSGEEAYAYLTEIRQIVRYLDICDGNMEEGSLRCDANISVRLKGEPKYGVRVEVKNMNSIRNVQRAIDHEIKRQIDAIEAGERIFMETRTFDAMKNITLVMRSKELANDYRYFPEPDLPALIVSQDWVERMRAEMPMLPKQLIKKYMNDYGLKEYDATVITETKEMARYYEAIIAHTPNKKSAANWLMGTVKSYMNELGLDMNSFKVSAESIAQIIALIDDGKLSNSAASQQIFPEMAKDPKRSPLEIAQALNLIQESDAGTLLPIIDEVLAAFPDKIEEYRNGKKTLMGLFVGEVMKRSKGKADPKLTNELLNQKLNANEE
jgi:aspartyl-tRNA(Asn)/glutamyl-tRNA(Gln) amidotransferase subunit B